MMPSVTTAGQDHLLFEVAGLLYAAPLEHIRVVRRREDVAEISPPQGVPPWWVGLALEGSAAFPLISLSSLWEDVPASSPTQRQAVLFTRDETTPTALLLDACVSVVRNFAPTRGRVADLPSGLKPSHARSFDRIVADPRGLIVTLDWEQLFSPQFRGDDLLPGNGTVFKESPPA